MSQPRLLGTDSAGFSGAWQDVHFDVWQMPGTAAQIRARLARQRAYIDELPAHHKVVTVAVVSDAATTQLSAEQKAAVDEGVRLSAPRVKGAAVVIQASGFKAVIIRSVMTGLTLVMPSKYPTKTFDSVESMFPWVAGLLDANDAIGRRPSGADVQAAFEAIAALARAGAH